MNDRPYHVLLPHGGYQLLGHFASDRLARAAFVRTYPPRLRGSRRLVDASYYLTDRQRSAF